MLSSENKMKKMVALYGLVSKNISKDKDPIIRLLKHTLDCKKFSFDLFADNVADGKNRPAKKKMFELIESGEKQYSELCIENLCQLTSNPFELIRDIEFLEKHNVELATLCKPFSIRNFVHFPTFFLLNRNIQKEIQFGS